MSEILLKTSGLTKKFKKHVAVNEVSIEIKRGEIYGFIGRNGAGKTTFLKMIGGLIFPTYGQVELFGKNCSKDMNLFSRCGVLVETPGLIGGMTAFENLKAKCIAYGIGDPSYIEELLSFVGLSNTGSKKTRNFSLGMKQRLGIALALIGNPDLLILDEPINGLDPQGIVEVRDTIIKLNKEKNMTIIISSHILEELSKIATKYGIIHEGKLIQQMTKDELFNQCSERIEIGTKHTKEVCVLLEEALHIHNYKVVSPEKIYVFEKLDEVANINIELSRRGVEIYSIGINSDNLETYFLNLTGGACHA